jgi:hypothetical protein
MVTEFPDFSYEHSWDDNNYNVQDGQGTRGTISFKDNFFVGGFNSNHSSIIEPNLLLRKAPKGIKKIAEEETLQYLLEERDQVIRPEVTTIFWGQDAAYSYHSTDEFFINGGSLIVYQLLVTEKAKEMWIENYDMNPQQINLMNKLYDRKIKNPNILITLTKEDRAILDNNDQEGVLESKNSFQEIGIRWY